MTPAAVFVRTLLRSSAIFIGAAAVVLHPSLEWKSAAPATAGLSVGAQPGGHQAALDALAQALKDRDVTVRRAAVTAIARISGVDGGPCPRPGRQIRARPAVGRGTMRR